MAGTPKKIYRVPITAKLEPSLKAWVLAYAQKTNITPSLVVREALLEYKASQKDNAN